MSYWRTLFDRSRKPPKPYYPVAPIGPPATTTTTTVTVSQAPSIVLGTLSFSVTSFTVGAVASGTINGATALSTITAAGLPAGLTINGAARTEAWDGSGSPGTGSISVTETLASASNSPRVSVISYSIAAASGTLSISTAPTLSGDAVVGQTIFATNGTYSATPDSYTPTWSVGGVVQSDQAGTTLLVLDDYAGSAIGYSEIAHKAAYTDSASNAATSTSAVANISLTNAITAFTRTSTSGTVPMTWSVTFGSNVYEGYYLRAQVYSDGTLTTQTQDVTHLLTNADLQSGATINLTSDGLTTIGATSYLKLSVETNSPNQLYYSYAYPTPISPTDAVVTVTWSPTDKFAANSLTYSNGNLTVAGGSGLNSVRTTRAVGSDKTYWEVTVSSGSIYTIGVADTSADLTHPLGPTLDGLTSSTDAGTWFNGDNGQFGYNGARDATYHDIGEFHTTPGTVAVALDRVAKKLWIGTVSGGVITWFNGNPATPTGGLSMASIGTMYPFLQMISATCTANFGTPGLTTGFAATPPTGFVAP